MFPAPSSDTENGFAWLPSPPTAHGGAIIEPPVPVLVPALDDAAPPMPPVAPLAEAEAAPPELAPVVLLPPPPFEHPHTNSESATKVIRGVFMDTPET